MTKFQPTRQLNWLYSRTVIPMVVSSSPGSTTLRGTGDALASRATGDALGSLERSSVRNWRCPGLLRIEQLAMSWARATGDVLGS